MLYHLFRAVVRHLRELGQATVHGGLRAAGHGTCDSGDDDRVGG